MLREWGSEVPCSRCAALGKYCGEKSRRGVSVEKTGLGNSETLYSNPELLREFFYQETKPNQQTERDGLKFGPGMESSNFKIPVGFELDKAAILDDAVRILARYHCTMEKEQIVSVVRNILSSWEPDSEQRGCSPTPTTSTEPKMPSRNITPDP